MISSQHVDVIVVDQGCASRCPPMWGTSGLISHEPPMRGLRGHAMMMLLTVLCYDALCSSSFSQDVTVFVPYE